MLVAMGFDQGSPKGHETKAGSAFAALSSKHPFGLCPTPCMSSRKHEFLLFSITCENVYSTRCVEQISAALFTSIPA